MGRRTVRPLIASPNVDGSRFEADVRAIRLCELDETVAADFRLFVRMNLAVSRTVVRVNYSVEKALGRFPRLLVLDGVGAVRHPATSIATNRIQRN